LKRQDNGPFNIFAEAETIIEFYDLDPTQAVWHGNYINYFELGRRSLLEKIGYSYNEMIHSGFSFPVVEISVKYLKPLKLRDRIRIKAILMEYEICLRIKYEIHNAETGAAVTRGLSAQMAYDIKADESCFVCPEALIKKVEYLINEQA
jgi:acyl-CoA thioester hydrolase